MRRFELHRHVDVSGVSGTGIVAHGIQWDDGTVSLRWRGDYPSFANWESIYQMLGAHGHSGKTTVVWVDEEAG